MNMTHKDSQSQLKPAQIASLDILKTIDKICRDNSLKYTLLNSALWGAVEYQGFLPWDAKLQIGLFYNDFIKLIDICKREFYNTEYYIIDDNNCEQYEEFYIQIAKRSRVILPEYRKKDEIYYDYTLIVYPIYYAGDTKSELKKLEKDFLFLFKCVHARKSAPGSVRLGNFKRKIKQGYYYKKKLKTSNPYQKIKKLLIRHTIPTKYVIVPFGKKSKGVISLASTYSDYETMSFEGYSFSIIKNARQWLLDFYGVNTMEKIKDRPVNQSILEGPEIIRRVQLIELDILREFDRICRKHNIKYNIGAGTLLGAVRHKGFIPWDDDIDVFMLYEDYMRFYKVAKDELDTEKYFLKTQETDHDCNLTFFQIKRNGTKYSKENREGFDTHPGILIDILPFFNGPRLPIVHFIQDKICKFYKTMTWAHIGANSERRYFRRKYYQLLSKTSNKTSYRKFIKYATMIKKKSNRLSYFYILRNFRRNPLNKRKNHEDLIEIEFEGHMFFAARDWDNILKYCYSDDYYKYPGVESRVTKHLPAVIDVGDFYSYDK